MNWQNWVVAVMLAMSFINRVIYAVSHRSDGESEWYIVAGLVVIMLWFGALVMLLHGGGFW